MTISRFIQKLFSLASILFIPLFSMASCATSSSENTESSSSFESSTIDIGATESSMTNNSKTLVVYFSRAGENWQVGNVEKGNTRIIVDYILEAYPFADFEVSPVTPYPVDYYEMLSVVREEQEQDSRPEYEGVVEGWDNYQNIILGYPIYNGTLPNIVLSFLEDYNFANKTIYPFSTHGGSGLGDTLSRLRSLCSGATIGSSFTISGSRVRSESAREATLEWIESLSLEEEGEQNTMLNFENIEITDNLSYTNEQMAVLNSYLQIMNAMITKDRDTLEEYVSEDIVITHMTGVTQTREEWIDEIMNGQLNYFHLTLSNIVITIENNQAFLTADSILDAAVYGGSRNSWSMHPRQTFTFNNNIWQRIA